MPTDPVTLFPELGERLAAPLVSETLEDTFEAASGKAPTEVAMGPRGPVGDGGDGDSGDGGGDDGGDGPGPQRDGG